MKLPRIIFLHYPLFFLFHCDLFIETINCVTCVLLLSRKLKLYKKKSEISFYIPILATLLYTVEYICWALVYKALNNINVFTTHFSRNSDQGLLK